MTCRVRVRVRPEMTCRVGVRVRPEMTCRVRVRPEMTCLECVGNTVGVLSMEEC